MEIPRKCVVTDNFITGMQRSDNKSDMNPIEWIR